MTETFDQSWQRRLSFITQALHARSAHAGRSVVLLPYAQLLAVAQQQWAQAHPNGFAPRFETTRSWSASLGNHAPQVTDITLDVALDLLTAQSLLEQAGLGAQAPALAARVLAAAHLLVPAAAAVPPQERAAWGARARAAATVGLEGPALAFEAAVAQIAVAWAANSGYVSDGLFDARLLQATDCVIALQGLQADPLLDSLAGVWGERMSVIALMDDGTGAHGAIQLHAARDAQDEAQRAAACVLRHLNAGRAPVALVASDRALTRRVRALLDGSGVRLRDENGWKLSTSRSGAHLMGALRACAWNASSDAVLDWLKNAPAVDASALRQLEAQLRRQPVREWRMGVTAPVLPGAQPSPLSALLESVNAQRQVMQRARPLAQWLTALRDLLVLGGQWTRLREDSAGERVLSALCYASTEDDSNAASGNVLPPGAPWAARRMSQSDFVQWVNQALEAASFKPPYPEQEDVVILPMSQMLGRAFAAVVIPGCDEVRLNPAPEPSAAWTAAQRVALGLPTRELQAVALQLAWSNALQAPQVDVLWRESDEGGQALLPSALVQLLRGHAGVGEATDPRAMRSGTTAPVTCPAPAAPGLAQTRWSASAYEDLRRCPYRYFALRLLGLQEADELEGELDKRDFGLWLHAVLKVFHEQLQNTGEPDPSTRRLAIDAAAAAVTQEQALAQDEFLPFMAAWPGVRDGYLQWLDKHEATGARFLAAERWLEQPLGALTLIGRLDRLDRMSGDVGHAASDAPIEMVMDYKTESLSTTRARIKVPLEDTQLAFYAALLPHDTLRAAYVNLSEREGTLLVEQKDVVAVRDALIEGILHDSAQIAGGAPMRAMGEGTACEFCSARGLCRKDYWTTE